MTLRSLFFGAALTALFALSAAAQSAPATSKPALPKLGAVKAFPAPGTYPTTESVTLIAPEPGATIHYTLDGSWPTTDSPRYDQLFFLSAVHEGNCGVKTQYTVRAIATKEGWQNSDPLLYQITIDPMNSDAYASKEVFPGVRMIRDFINAKMFLVEGEKACALIDSGCGNGALRSYVEQFTKGLPLLVIFTHSHGDHIGQADQFIHDSVEYIGSKDKARLVQRLQRHQVSPADIDRHVQTVKDGDRIDLGGRVLTILDVPGHTPGSIVVFDEQTGRLFSGDAIGSNVPSVPDAAWMQWVEEPLDGYLSVVRNLQARVHGRITAILTGHNDQPLRSETYLDNVAAALQSLMDRGEAVLKPSDRPPGLKQVSFGDRLTDPNWAAINVNAEHCLPGPIDQISSLSLIGIDGAKLDGVFSPKVHAYRAVTTAGAKTISIHALPTSSRARSIKINGRATEAGAPTNVALTETPIEIVVTSPDGSESTTYHVTVDAS